MRLPLAALAFASFLAACNPRLGVRPGEVSAADVRAEGGFWLTEGATADLDSNFRFTLVDVVSDRRCPANAMCVVAGEAVVVVGPSHPNMRFAPDTLRLSEGPGGRVDTVEVWPYRLVLREVQPYPGTEVDGSAPTPRRARFERVQ